MYVSSIKGGSLETFLKENKYLEFDQVLNWLVELVSAIRYLHANGCVHRDLKPKYKYMRKKLPNKFKFFLLGIFF